MFFVFFLSLLWARTPAYYVVDTTGNVLCAHNERAQVYPASLTKMLTLYILFEELRKGSVSFSTRFRASHRASVQMPSKLGLKPQETISVRDCVMALITKSANDVAVTVAENISGSIERFASRMNITAQRLGMHRSRFYNPSGVPDTRQVTTALDMSILARALHTHFSNYYPLFNTKHFKFKKRMHKNHNNLLGKVHGVDGIKTGYIGASGFNIATSTFRNGKRVFAVVFGGESASKRDKKTAQLIEAAFRSNGFEEETQTTRFTSLESIMKRIR